MEHKKDIGKAIKEKLDAFDKTPGDGLWAAIEADLPKKKKRRILPFWISFISVAVIGLLLWSLLGNPDTGWLNDGSKSRENNVQQNDGNYDSNKSDANNGSNPNSPNGLNNDQNDDANPDGNFSTDDNVNSTVDAESGPNNGSSPTSGTNPKIQAGNNADENANAEGKPSRGSHYNSKISSTAKKQILTSKNGKRNKKNKNADTNNIESGAGNINLAQAESNPSAKKPISTEDGAAGTPGQANTVQTVVAGSSVTTSGTTSATEKEKTVTDSIAKAIAEEKKKKAEKSKDSLVKQELEAESFKTFRVFLYAAPTYYNTFSEISSIDTGLDSLTRKAEITYNYGGYLVFDYDDKWAFRFGVAKTSLRYRTKDIPVSTLDQQNYYNVDYGNVSNLELQDRFSDSERFDLVQDISYLEFPVELKYKLINNKFGIEGIGGISTSMLKSNNVTAESDNNGSVIIGETKDQYKVYFSVNVGAGFYWQFTNSLRLNVEPLFKYHFRTASTALQPYSVVVLGGLEYTFNWRSKKKADKK